MQLAAQLRGRGRQLSRMWHYTEGLRTGIPIWPNHDIRCCRGVQFVAGPSGGGCRTQLSGFDTLGSLAHLTTHGYLYSWFVLNRAIIKRLALSGSEQNPIRPTATCA